LLAAGLSVRARPRAEVIWTVDGRSVVVVGRRGERRFEESAG
jgi:hypothetical protein